MTATVATIGMMPAALATGVGSDVQRGLATVVVGGLILATLLTLFILPTFYYSLERIAARWAPRREPARLPTRRTDGTRCLDCLAIDADHTVMRADRRTIGARTCRDDPRPELGHVW